MRNSGKINRLAYESGKWNKLQFKSVFLNIIRIYLHNKHIYLYIYYIFTNVFQGTFEDFNLFVTLC